MPKQKIQEGVG